ncbi:MAG: cyclic nucleotide-binding domain-containing protein [Desulfobacteraceae bacterium]|nr:cyclic nucleotide-binding domain-containing protein [Desulfobacteraceae bacterium]
MDFSTVPFPEHWSPGEVLPWSTLVLLKKGERLKISEDSSRALYYVDSGAMEVSYTTGDTKIVVASIGNGQFFGEIGFFDGGSRVRDVCASEESRISMFSQDKLERFRKDDPGLYSRFITVITRSICVKFRRILGESEPLKAYAASLSTGARRFVESRAISQDFFKTGEGSRSNAIVEALKVEMFDLSVKLQQDHRDEIPAEAVTRFNRAMDTFFDSLGGFAPELAGSPVEEEVWAYIFKETFPYFMRSALTERAYFKPNGYAGDFKMIDMMYRNRPCGSGKIGRLVDAWLLNRPPCMAVRGRRKFIAEKLDKMSRGIVRQKNRVRIMNLACGPSRELFDFIKGFEHDSRVHAICLDIDPEALQYTGEQSRSFDHKATISYLKDNLIKWALGTSSHEIELQDIIYSGGLFDYLDDDLFVLLANRCYDQLGPGGSLMVGNFRPNSDKVFMDRLLEWRLVYRDAEALVSLFAKTKFTSDIEVVAEERAGIQLFAIGTKP